MTDATLIPPSPAEDDYVRSVQNAEPLPLLPEGIPYKVGEFIRMSGGGGPDGLAMDARGNLAVAHLGLGTVWLFSALGEPLLRIRSCAGSRG